MRHYFLAFALLCAVAPSFAAAPESAYPYPGASIGGRLAYFRGDDADRGTWGPGAQARWTFNRRFAVEASGDYQRQAFPETTAHTGAFQGSALVYFLHKKVSPYILGGGGMYLTRVNAPNYRRNTSRFGPHLGVGAQFWATPSLSADASYRYVWLDDLDSRTTAGANRTFRRSGSMFTFAVNLHLDTNANKD